jgi:hypothetical protein
MRVVHRRQVIVVDTIRRPIDAVVLQILELIPKVPESSMSRRVFEQVSGRSFDIVWRPQLRLRIAKWRLLSSTPILPIKYEQNTVFFPLRWVIMIYLGLPIGNRVHNHIWSRSSGPAMQSAGSRHDRERLKYKQESTACPSHIRPPVRWACPQEMSNTLPAPSLRCCSGTSQTRTNPNKILVCT